jgi:hypothetical protein
MVGTKKAVSDEQQREELVLIEERQKQDSIQRLLEDEEKAKRQVDGVHN